MALIKCPECGKEISDKAIACPHCGFPIEKNSTEQKKIITDQPMPIQTTFPQMKCQFCGADNDQGSMYCGYCGKLIDSAEIQQRIQLENLILQQKQLQVQQKQFEVQSRIQYQQIQEYNSMARCPKCGSASLSGHKKGFGVGKAVIGAFAFGPLGLVAGNIGAKKVRVTCLNCGKQFWA